MKQAHAFSTTSSCAVAPRARQGPPCAARETSLVLGPLSRLVLADAIHSCSFVPVLVPDGATSVDEQAGVGGRRVRVREAPEEGLSCVEEFADVIDGCSGA